MSRYWIVANLRVEGQCLFCRKFHRVVTWQFSCSLTPASCHFRVSSKAGNVSATLHKQTDVFNRGPSALPLRTIDDSELTPFRSASEIREFLDRTMLAQAMFESSHDVELRTRAMKNNAIITDPFYCLRETIDGIWQIAYKHPEVCFCVHYCCCVYCRACRLATLEADER